MPRILSASCSGGVVTVEGHVLSMAQILSEGVGASSGIVTLDSANVTYIAKTSPDLKTAIEKTAAALDDIAASIQQIALSLTSIGAGMTGPTTAPPPTLATDVATLATKVASIQASRALLNTLKEALR
jgi:methyl-accepting chemotaxis protein